MAAERQKLNVMFVYAHVADSAKEASGTAAIHNDLGDTVTTAICTLGERHHNDLFLEADETPA